MGGCVAKLGDISSLKGKGPMGISACVLRLLKYGSRAQLEALAKLCGKEEGFDDQALLLEARRRLQNILEKAHAAGKATEEEVLDGIMALGYAYMRRTRVVSLLIRTIRLRSSDTCGRGCR